MDTEKLIQDLIDNGHKTYIGNLSIDCTIFGYHERRLKVLLLKWKGIEGWSLPGGRIKKTETLQAAAARILQERTGLANIFLKQYQVFGDSDFRVKQPEMTNLLKAMKITVPKNNWLADRTFSIGFYALVEYSEVDPKPDLFTEECNWCDINELPELLFDHNEMVDLAQKTLRQELSYLPIGSNLLPKKFTLPEIHDLYETLLGKSLDRRNFPKKLLALGIIKKLAETRNIGAHRSPFLYRFDMRNYNRALQEGLAVQF
ncbi:NUDIX hydrolase [Flavihumibacter fluvii]|uniref:NUDIX hydrolase n=1 Tax=Flavihumibacter fluvii TaxID=2838157 RepID=UPI001BDE43C2|nr:NUDIX domain-containing protein [Flavihumibacter fluvii]ULQ54590.1 NUDIX domain-containing protein [Flavihumibacter fluvii]